MSASEIELVKKIAAAGWSQVEGGSRLRSSRMRLAALRSAGELAGAIDTASAICAVYREGVEAGLGTSHGPDWNRCRILYRSTPMLARIIEAAVQPPVAGETADQERALGLLAARQAADAGAAFAYVRESLAIYEQWCAGRLGGVASIEEARRIAGLGDDENNGQVVGGAA